LEVPRFEDIQEEFMARVSQAVYCTMATVDRKNRPRTRLMHPIWEGYTGWILSWPGSHKSKHLARNPAVSLAYAAKIEQPVYVEGVAEWITAVEEQQRVWDLHRMTPPPLGFDPAEGYGTITHRYFGVLRITPWRIELGQLYGESRIWRRDYPISATENAS
jgi:uncharacterized pyridoxamine 5'-phosphate oxidase family protein